MANEALIQGAKFAYGGGTSAGAAMRQANIQAKYGGRSQGAAMAAMQKKAERKAVEAEMEETVKGYVDGIPADFDVSQIPQKYRGAIQAKLLEMKQRAAQAAQDITQYQPGEVGYQQNVDIINGVKNAMNNMKDQFTNFGTGKKTFLEDYENKNFSQANDPSGKMNSLSKLYTDNLDVRIGDDGNLFFSGDGVEEFNLNTADQDAPFNKANSQAKEFLSLNKDIYNSGKKLSPAETQMHRNQVANILDSGGWEVTQSFLADDLFGTPLNKQISTVEIDGQQVSLDEAMDMANSNDTSVSVSAREAINQAVENQLMDHLSNSANKGYANKNTPGETGDTPAGIVKGEMGGIMSSTSNDFESPNVQVMEYRSKSNPHVNIDGSPKDKAKYDQWEKDNPATRYHAFPNVTNSYNNKILLYDKNRGEFRVGNIEAGEIVPSGIYIKGKSGDAAVDKWINKNFK